MNLRRILSMAGFALLAAGIWLRHPLGEAADALLPALAAFPLYFWISQPWRWRETRGQLRGGAAAAGGAALFLGATLDSTLLLALGWSGLWHAWVRSEVREGSFAGALRPLVLLTCGFPWLGTEGQVIGWWFRYSGAWASEGLFAALGLAVTRDGTFLNVQGMPLAVDEACSGLNALQAMLVAGSVLALTVLPGWRFWLGMALLPLLAWLANLMRIMTIGITGLSFGPDAAMGWFHTWGGWAVLMLMFGLCSAVFHLIARGTPMRRPA